MALRESPFSSGFLEGLHTLGWGLILPCFWFLDRLIAVCRPTSLERTQQHLEQECYLHPLKVFSGIVLFLSLFIITAPVAFLGFLLWAPLQAVRRPFSYHRGAKATGVSGPQGDGRSGWEQQGEKGTFSFVTANLCLLPDSLARFNNLADTQLRAAAIGQHIAQGVNRPHIRIFVDSPSSCGTLSLSNSLLTQAAPPSYGATDIQAEAPVAEYCGGIDAARDVTVDVQSDVTGGASDSLPPASAPPTTNVNQNSNQRGSPGSLALRSPDPSRDVPCEVSTLFPANVDVVCLEEVFDKRAAQKLTEALRPVFGHILYDVGVYACHSTGCCSSFKFFNSGLFLASRYPLLEAQYHCFPNGRGEDALAAKGLLCVKVLIGQTQRQKRVVGYFNCTHLHAPEGEGVIRHEQLNMLTKWIAEFQVKTKQADDLVVFDLLCGDFNFDNCSPDDELEQKHVVFEDYRDPCRAGPGKEKPWVIGTLLEQPTLYDDNVRTPENLQKTLEREELRKQYVSPPVALRDYPESGQPWVGRRLDYILYRESSLAKHCHTELEEFTFVTQLAGLTDHIPVGLRLNVVLNSDQADH